MLRAPLASRSSWKAQRGHRKCLHPPSLAWMAPHLPQVLLVYASFTSSTMQEGYSRALFSRRWRNRSAPLQERQGVEQEQNCCCRWPGTNFQQPEFEKDVMMRRGLIAYLCLAPKHVVPTV